MHKMDRILVINESGNCVKIKENRDQLASWCNHNRVSFPLIIL